MKRLFVILFISFMFFSCESPVEYVENDNIESWEYTVVDEDTYYNESGGFWVLSIKDERVDSNAMYEVYTKFLNVWLKLEMYYYESEQIFIYMQLISDDENIFSITTHEDFTGYELKIFKIGK